MSLAELLPYAAAVVGYLAGKFLDSNASQAKLLRELDKNFAVLDVKLSKLEKDLNGLGNSIRKRLEG